MLKKIFNFLFPPKQYQSPDNNEFLYSSYHAVFVYDSISRLLSTYYRVFESEPLMKAQTFSIPSEDMPAMLNRLIEGLPLYIGTDPINYGTVKLLVVTDNKDIVHYAKQGYSVLWFIENNHELKTLKVRF